MVVAANGMGRDGAHGCQLLKDQGGYVFAQHADGCTVYGMPKAVVDANLADRVVPLSKMAKSIQRFVRRQR